MLALGRQTRELERCFHGFGTAIREEADLQIARSEIGERLGERCRLRVEHDARGERHVVELFAHCLNDRWGAGTQA